MTMRPMINDPKIEGTVQKAIEVAITTVYESTDTSYTDAARFIEERADSVGQAILHREMYIPGTPESDQPDIIANGPGWECDCKHCGAYRTRYAAWRDVLAKNLVKDCLLYTSPSPRD